MTVAVRIIPCLDIRAGRVVKGVNFENIIDAGDPVETAERYNTEGADELCFLDIDASYENRSATLSTCLLYTSPSPRDAHESRMPSSA